jgi:hypothetical protein
VVGIAGLEVTAVSQVSCHCKCDCDVTPCSLVDVHRVSKELTAAIFRFSNYSSTLKMEAMQFLRFLSPMRGAA